MLVEREGTPATVLITEPFQGLVTSHAVKLGASGYHALVVRHPIWSQDDDALRALAGTLVNSALAQLA